MTHFPMRSFVSLVPVRPPATSPQHHDGRHGSPDGSHELWTTAQSDRTARTIRSTPSSGTSRTPGAGGVDLNLNHLGHKPRRRVLVAVVDDGVEIRHEDLAINTKESAA